MSPVVRDITELTDSVEMLEKKPPVFMRVYILLILIIIIIASIWSYFSKMDISVRSNAIVQSTTSSIPVKTEIPGSITDIKVKSGQKVKKGQILVTLGSEEIDLEKKQLVENISAKMIDISNMKTLIDIINSKTTLQADAQDEMKAEYVNYQSNLELLKNEVAIQKEDIKKQLNSLTVDDADTLGLRSDISVLNDQNKDLLIQINDLEEKNKVQNINADVLNVNQSKIEELKKQSDLNKKTISLKEKQLNNHQTQIGLNKKSIEDTLKLYNTNLENKIANFRTSKISELENKIQEKTKELGILQQELGTLDLTEKKKLITSLGDGIIEMPTQLKKGDKFDKGEVLFSVAPVNRSARALLYISAKDINKIHKGDKVKYTFDTGKTETFYGHVRQIFHDPVLNNKGGAPSFLVEGSFGNNPNPKLKSGSQGRGAIVVEQQNVLTILLEKLELLNK